MNPFFYKLAQAKEERENPYLVPGVIAGGGAGVSAGLGYKAREGLKERSATKNPIKEYRGRISNLEGAKKAIESGDISLADGVDLDEVMGKHKGELDKLKGAKSKATKKMLGFGAGSALAAAGAAYGGKKLYDKYKERSQDKTAAKRPTFSSAYDDSPELKGGQKRLPDSLQKKIVLSKLKSRIARRGDNK